MNKISLSLEKHLDSILLFVFCLLIFTYIIIYVPTDIIAHINHALKINLNESSYPANFLFYFSVNFFSGFSNYKPIIYPVTITLLSLATLAKYVISKKIILGLILKKQQQVHYNKVCLIALGLFFCFAIPDPFSLFVLKKMYLAKFAPMVWHNSTTIFLFPFAILLFWKQLKFLDFSYEVRLKDIFVINFLVVMNLAIKPSFIFTYAPVTFLFLLSRFKVDTIKNFMLKLSPIFTSGVFILVQYYLLFNLQQGSIQEESSGILISTPFEALSHWIPLWFIPISLFLSFCLPIFSMIIFKEIIKYRPFYYSLSLTIVGLIISAFIMESGPRMYHCNFMWQNVICSYLLLLSTVSFLVPKFISKDQKVKKVLLLKGLFLAHSLSGLLYLLKIFFTKNYF